MRKKNSPRRQSRNYEVGWGRPPQASRWRPGQSGNPKGRPKGTGPEGRWLLGALGFGQSGLCENPHYKPRSIPAYLKQQC